MKAALLLLVLLIRGPSVVTMHGRVTDSSTGKPIPAASVVMQLNLGTHTDSLGRSGSLGPSWYPIALALTSLPSTWMGGSLAKR